MKGVRVRGVTAGRTPILRQEWCWQVLQLTWVSFPLCFPFVHPSLAGHSAASMEKKELLKNWGGGKGSLAPGPDELRYPVAPYTQQKK